MDATNDNRPAPAGLIPIIGVVRDDGAVTITDPTWRPTPRPTPHPVRDAGEAEP